MDHEMHEPADQICRQCHAVVPFPGHSQAIPAICPACGGTLVPRPGPNLDAPGVAPRQVDHRGILLPSRHAVGGVIIPR